MPFLEKIALRLIKKFPNDMKNVQIVLPSKRSIVFFKHYISRNIKEPIFLPKISSIEDFILELSGLEILDNISLQFKLYQSYKKIEKQSADTFENFLKWSAILLNDYNEIDKNLVDAEKLYSNLQDIKKLDNWNIDNWSFSESKLTDLQKDHITFSNKMYHWYIEFNTNLLNCKLAYPGLAYKKASENIVNYQFNYNQIWFVGLNALTISEKLIIDHLKKKDISRVFWDADKMYYDNSLHEAGEFLRIQREKWHEIDFQGVGDYWSKKKESFNIISCPKNISQVKVARQVLENMQQEDLQNSHTAVVLANESLLLPMLHHLPSEVQKINITMGSELKNTSLFSFFQLIFNLQIQLNKLKKGAFFYKDILDLISHPYFIKLTNKELCLSVKKEFYESKKIFYKPSEVLSYFSSEDKIENIFNIWGSSSEAILFLNKIMDCLLDNINKTRSDLESEIIVKFNKIILLLDHLFNDLDFKVEITTLQAIFNQIISSEIVPFDGEPLEGLQLMGILESRTLDFKNIIMLSVNEGILPKGKFVDTFIPYDLKKYFKLPTSTDRDAVFSYHFYRLLQRAKNITLIYNSETDDFGSGEKSRFITQLTSEYKHGNINKLIYNGESLPLKNKESSLIVNNITLQSKIKSWMANGVSPSSIIKYNNCSMAFYFHYLAKIKPNTSIDEFADNSTVGNIIHEALAHHYSLGFLTKHQLEDTLYNIPNTIKLKLEEKISKDNIIQGKNYLSLKAAQELTINFLKLELKLLKDAESKNKKINISSIEKELIYKLPLEGLFVKLVGWPDRIDMVGNNIRIIDYKTGKVSQSDLIISDISDLIDNPKKSKAFQLFMYMYLYAKNNPSCLRNEVFSAIYSFKNLKSGLLFLSKKEKGIIKKIKLNVDIIDEFEKQLKILMLRIINDDFIETDDKSSYEWMDYEMIYKL